MSPTDKKDTHPPRNRRGLFLWRSAVCLCGCLILFGAATGTAAVIRAVSGAVSAAPAGLGTDAGIPPSSALPPQPNPAASDPKDAPSSPSDATGSGAAPSGWFSDALFIGDSRTEGLRNYDGLPGATYYAVKGLMVSTVYTRREIPLSGRKMTVMQAAAAKKYGKIYIMLGVNELGWSSMAMFVSDYRKMLDDLKQDQPKARIYLQALFPVSAEKSSESSIYNNDRIASYNHAIRSIAEEEKLFYLDAGKAFSVGGVLPDAASEDGVHLNADYCAKWCGYLQTHIQGE